MLFVFSFNPMDSSIHSNTIDGIVKNNRFVNEYHSPFPGTYFLKTNATLNEIVTSFSEMLGPRWFIVNPMDLSNVDGPLPKGVWTWLAQNNYNYPAIPYRGS